MRCDSKASTTSRRSPATRSRNLDFYTRVLGLRLAAKTVNQDDPSVYHLFYADEQGRPGSELTFFEYPRATPGRAGAGHGPHDRLARRRARGARLLGAAARRRGLATSVRTTRCASPTSKGCATSWSCGRALDEPLTRRAPGDPARARAPGLRRRARLQRRPRPQRRPAGEGAERAAGRRRRRGSCAGSKRGSTIEYDKAPSLLGRQSAGTVHHVAWGTNVVEHKRWHELLQLVGVANSGIIDRHYFHSIYFREPSGVLFEIADDYPGFTVDVPLDQLGSVVILPPRLEPQRAEIEKRLTPLPDPRAAWVS